MHATNQPQSLAPSARQQLQKRCTSTVRNLHEFACGKCIAIRSMVVSTASATHHTANPIVVVGIRILELAAAVPETNHKKDIIQTHSQERTLCRLNINTKVNYTPPLFHLSKSRASRLVTQRDRRCTVLRCLALGRLL